MVVFGKLISAWAGADEGVTKEGGKHGEGADGEVVLSAEPFGDLAGFLAEGIGELLLAEASFVHEVADLGRDGEGEVNLGGYVLWDIGEHLLEFIVDGFHCSRVFGGFTLRGFCRLLVFDLNGLFGDGDESFLLAFLE